MGALFSAIFDSFTKKRETRILMLGLDAAGKTTILYKFKLGEHITTIPTIGFNVEHIEYNKLDLTVWDVGGQLTIRRLWRHYYHGTEGLIFVVDSSDTSRIDEAREELQNLLEQDELRDAAVLVYANKQDLPYAINPKELSEKLGLTSIVGRPWQVQGACATTGDGLYEGLNWLSGALLKKK